MQINIDIDKYQQLCERNRQKALKRWSKDANDATVFFAMHNNNCNNNSNINSNNNKNNSSKAAKDINNNGEAVKAAAAADIVILKRANQQVTKQIVDGESIPSLQVVKQCFQTARTILSDS